MATKTAQRKAQLREDLTAAAQKRIETNGIKDLRARDLAADAGCSVGAIYNVFEDIDELILTVGLRTLKTIDAVMTESMLQTEGQTPIDRMIAMAHTYVDFAAEHTNAWKSLFEHRLPADYELPEWHEEGQDVLFRHIEAPLAELLPQRPPSEHAMLARTLFAAVHGIVVLAREQRVVGIPDEAVKKQLDIMLRAFARGIVNQD